MAGRIVDLASFASPVPELIVLDSNVVIAWQIATYEDHRSQAALRAAAFVEALTAGNQQALLTPTAYSEVVHATVKAIYQRSRADHRAALMAHYGRAGGFSWRDLYKINPTLLQQQTVALNLLRQRLTASNIVLLDHADLGPLPSGQRYDRELLDLVVRYGLDTSDSTILLEAMRIGVHSVVSFDRDMQRAVADFDVYTWLS